MGTVLITAPHGMYEKDWKGIWSHHSHIILPCPDISKAFCVSNCFAGRTCDASVSLMTHNLFLFQDKMDTSESQLQLLPSARIQLLRQTKNWRHTQDHWIYFPSQLEFWMPSSNVVYFSRLSQNISSSEGSFSTGAGTATGLSTQVSMNSERKALPKKPPYQRCIITRTLGCILIIFICSCQVYTRFMQFLQLPLLVVGKIRFGSGCMLRLPGRRPSHSPELSFNCTTVTATCDKAPGDDVSIFQNSCEGTWRQTSNIILCACNMQYMLKLPLDMRAIATAFFLTPSYHWSIFLDCGKGAMCAMNFFHICELVLHWRTVTTAWGNTPRKNTSIFLQSCKSFRGDCYFFHILQLMLDL